MRRKILALAAAVAIGTATMTSGAMAFRAGGGGGGGGHVSGGFGGHAMSMGGGVRGMAIGGGLAGARTVAPGMVRGNFIGPRTNFASPVLRGNRVAGNWGHGNRGHHHHHFHRRFFFAGLGLYGYDWPYYGYNGDSCYVLTAYGWAWVC